MAPRLIVPGTRWSSQWLDCHREWGPGLHEDGFGLRADDDVDSIDGVAAWIDRLRGDTSTDYRWIVDSDQIAGGIALRHNDSNAIEQAGHIGFGIRVSARRRGLAGFALRQTLVLARGYGLDRVLLVCADDNVASASTIESVGGVLDGIVETPLGTARRYRLSTAGLQG